MRITVVAKGELEEYIQHEMERTGLSAGMTCLQLALAGMEYKQSIRGLSAFASALDKMTCDNKEDDKSGKGKV